MLVSVYLVSKWGLAEYTRTTYRVELEWWVSSHHLATAVLYSWAELFLKHVMTKNVETGEAEQLCVSLSSFHSNLSHHITVKNDHFHQINQCFTGRKSPDWKVSIAVALKIIEGQRLKSQEQNKDSYFFCLFWTHLTVINCIFLCMLWINP